MKHNVKTLGRIDPAMILLLILLVVPALLSGCTDGFFGGEGSQEAGVGRPLPSDKGGGALGDQISLTSDVALSGNLAYTILYTVPTTATSVRAFYAPADQGDDRSIWIFFDFATPLSAGSSQFTISTADLDRGSWVIGVSYMTAQGEPGYVLSSGRLIIQGVPTPTFVAPSESATVLAGAVVPIAVDLGDPEGDVAWRLFYISQETAPDLGSIPPDQVAQLGTELAAGTGNAASHDWSTTSVAVGAYLIGVSATDSGFAVGEAAAAGFADQIVTVYSNYTVSVIDQEPQPPSLAVLEPAADVTFLFESGSVEVTFEVDLAGETFVALTVFYDTDNVFDNGAEVIASGLEATDTMVTWELGDEVDEGMYFVGARLEYGDNGSLVAYASGQVTLVREAKLTVTEPSENVTLGPGDTVTISWETNVPASVAQTEVYVQGGDSNETIIVQPLGSAGGTSATWDPAGRVGLYTAWVGIDFDEESLEDPPHNRAPGEIRVASARVVHWLGATDLQKEVFQGVNFQDNAGVFLDTVEDLDEDNHDDFMITARYGKPYFQNPSGIGIGEAYLIYGGDRRNEKHNLNTVGTAELKGIVFPGVRPREDFEEATEGLSAVRRIPDQDGDGRFELMFGMPFTDSRGHTYPLAVRDEPEAQNSLEKPRQFVRGGVVIVSSRNTWLSDPPDVPETVDPDAPLSEKAAIYLDLVGQNFLRAQVHETQPNPEFTACDQPDYFRDEVDDSGDACFETFVGPWDGFNRVLADSFPVVQRPFQFPFPNTSQFCSGFSFAAHRVLIPQEQFLRQCALHHNRGDDAIPPSQVNPPAGQPSLLETDTADTRIGSGFYPLRFCDHVDDVLRDNAPLEPFGARIIGRGDELTPDEPADADDFDKFGSSIAVSGGFALISAPNRTPDPFEVDGTETRDLDDNGVIYMLNINHLWPDWHDIMQSTDVGGGSILDGDQIHGNFEAGIFVAMESITGRAIAPPMPYQYQIETEFQCGRGGSDHTAISDTPTFIDNRPFHVLGERGQNIQVVEALPDFNLDSREDFAIGAPLANNEEGRVYVCYRRDPAVEGDYLLSKLSLDPMNNERLAGLRINGRPGASERFGQVLTRSLTVQGKEEDEEEGLVFSKGIDFNGDAQADLVLPNPYADNHRGEIIIVFADRDLVSPADGFDIQNPNDPDRSLLDLRRPDGTPRAIRITGASEGDEFGFNAAVVGDVDGDMVNDLLVAAPMASPLFDASGDGIPDTPGLDIDPQDGIADDLNGDGRFGDEVDQLIEAGIVYLILGSNLLESQSVAATGEISVSKVGTLELGGLAFVGRQGMFVSLPDGTIFQKGTGDRLGGGVDELVVHGGAGDPRHKRSFGVGSAGDVDADGLNDYLFSAILADPEGRTNAGEVYLIYGFPPGTATQRLPGAVEK